MEEREAVDSNCRASGRKCAGHSRRICMICIMECFQGTLWQRCLHAWWTQRTMNDNVSRCVIAALQAF